MGRGESCLKSPKCCCGQAEHVSLPCARQKAEHGRGLRTNTAAGPRPDSQTKPHPSWVQTGLGCGIWWQCPLGLPSSIKGSFSVPHLPRQHSLGASGCCLLLLEPLFPLLLSEKGLIRCSPSSWPWDCKILCSKDHVKPESHRCELSCLDSRERGLECELRHQTWDPDSQHYWLCDFGPLA